MRNLKEMIYILISLIILANSLPNFKKQKSKNEKLKSNHKTFKENVIEKPKEYYDDLIEKGLIADNLIGGSPPPESYKPINFKKDKIKRKEILQKFTKKKNRRKLYETQTLEDLGFIDIYKNTSYAVRFVMNNLKREESKFILYPYPFSYTDKENIEKTVNNGGFFHLNQTQLTGESFTYIQNITSATIGKAKGIYDIDIGIMSLLYIFNGNEIDLFTEASTYCDYFVFTLDKISSCVVGKDGYLEYKNKYPNKGAVVRISNEDLLKDILFDPQTKQLKIKLLIFSDYLNNNEETIFDKYLKEEEISIIKEFRDLGGHILVSGKSGYLLERMGFIPENTYDTSFTITTKNNRNENINPISGCNIIYKNTPDEQEDFFKQLMCMGYLDYTYLSRTFTIKTVPDTFESLIQYTNRNKFLQMIKDGYETNIDDENISYDYILVSKEDSEKGRIMIVNGNPIQNRYYLIHTRNFIFYAMSKNIIYDLKIKFNSNTDDDLPIPAGEEGVQLVTSFKIFNLDVTDMRDVEVNILFAKGIKLISENGCSFIENDKNKYKDLNDSSIDNEKYLKCISDTIIKLNKLEKEFKLEITDYKVTQKLVDIPLMYSKITYKQKSKECINTPGIFYVQAEAAALLRGTINKDPTSYWPMDGWGVYFDLVLAVENKENTIARDVNYISIIPLVSPLIDGSDQNQVARIIPLYEKYYEKHKYSYPWVSTEDRGTDYIDYVEVAGKGVCYVSDFDTPVKIKKIPRSEVENIVENLYTPGDNDKPDNYAKKTKATSANSLLKQVYFGDNEQFYETAEARTSLFINTATKEGAFEMYGNNIPDDLKDPHNETRAKTQYAFVRVDTYFYSSEHEQYQLPNGLDSNILISLDKFEQNDYPPQENKKLGDIRKQIVNIGHYDSTIVSGPRLKPNEWANTLRQYSFLKQYDPTKTEDLIELQRKTTDTIRLSHFLFPFSNKEIKKAGSIYGFIENPDGSGYLENYETVKFIYGHSINLVLDPSNTRLGGKAEIYLGEARFNDENDKIIDNERVTTSADNVAFYQTEYDNNENKVILYFRRGLMPNENYGQPSKCKVFLENLNKNENFNVIIKIYNLKYDFSQNNLESQILVSELNEQLAEYGPFFSFPCLYIENKLKRKPTYSEEYSYDMNEYELMNTYARYGGYYQELTKHASVYATAEAHHVANPGFQSISDGFTLIGNIGTSPIPFGEFLEHGQLLIPGAVSTSRLEWTDIWGRKWGQNLRSVYPDIPPIPPAPLSFIMTTTYELITNDEKQERVLEWQSDESVYIRIQMKIRNTYKLYWEPTFCLENQKPFIKNEVSEYRSPIFLTPEEPEELSGVRDEHDINLGFNSTYGVCYKEGSYIEGQEITKTIAEKMWEMMSCSADANATAMTECSNKVKGLNLPKLVRKPDNINVEEKKWNYSPLIEEYLPKGYIHSDLMWQLTMETDYWDDDSFYKGYPFHLDDNIPNLDNSNTKPHDLIAFPIYKGLGYNITYDNSYTLKNYSEYKGWWSDQLQNKDHTLLAGQEKVNNISVGQNSLIKDSNWINAKKLKYSPKTRNLAKERLKNIYVCQFNQHRVKITPYQQKYAFLKNVYQNNVIPVLPDLTENDPRYYNFNCNDENSYQYTPYNISKVDNRVYTGNDRDWLYFAAGLRGNGRENINVILKLSPIDGTLFEGITKVQDGGRFTYWQPPDGPNSYGYFDGNVNTVISKRVDLSLTHRMIPTEFFTFNFNTYQLFSIADKKEDKREFTMNIYTNSHGYGDATTTVYVGGIDSTKCRVEPNQYTFVKIVFYNNAGFDWIMKENAIEYNDVVKKARLNAMSIMNDINTAIKYPTKYNFITPIIPEEIKNYVSLTPSQHVSDVSPQFYDLTFNNVLNIKDALEGDYFYCLNVSSEFPNKYKGKLWEIPLILNESYFESLPSVNDPTGIHNYHLTIPSIRFGVPISSGKYQGKIFYNLGQAKDLKFTYQIHKSFQFEGIKIVTENDIIRLFEATDDTNNIADNLKNVWEMIDGYPNIAEKIKISNYTLNDFYQEVTVDLSDAFPIFPYEQEQEEPAPFVTNISILIKTFSGFIPFGYKNHLILSNISYNDFRKQKNTYADYPLYINCYSKGPSIRPSFSTKVVKFDKQTSSYVELEPEKQNIYEGVRTTIKLTVSAINEGTSGIFYPIFNLGINPDAIYKQQETQNNNLKYVDKGVNGDIREISISYDGSISPNEERKFDLYFEMKFEGKNNLRNLEISNIGSFSLVKSLNVTLCLENNKCEKGSSYYGVQTTEKTYKIKYILGENGENFDDENENEETKENKEDKKRFKTYIIFIIIIVGLLVILGGGFLIYKYAFGKKKEEKEEKEINNELYTNTRHNIKDSQTITTTRRGSLTNKKDDVKIYMYKI